MTSSTQDEPEHELESVAAELLVVTEELHHAVTNDLDAAVLFTAYDRREELFYAIEAVAKRGVSLNAASRACLSRIKVLDDEMLAIGITLFGEIRGERLSLIRRRSAIAAHSSRERSVLRLLTVKA